MTANSIIYRQEKKLEQSYTDKKLLTLYIGSINGVNFQILVILYHRIAKVALFRFSAKSAASALLPHRIPTKSVSSIKIDSEPTIRLYWCIK